jgi:hypothetical protein
MFTNASRLAKTVGLAAGLLLIGGSLVGGIALAADNGDLATPSPAVTGTAVTTPGSTTGAHPGDDDDDAAAHGPDERNGHDDCDEGEASDDDCAATPTATPSPSQSPHDDDNGDDHGGDNDHHGSDD